jgi:hypothetical protein
MATSNYSFTDAIITTHRDVFRAIQAMPRLTAIVVVLLVLQALLELAAGALIPEQSLLGSGLVSIVYDALITPFLIAVHRFIVLGEVTHQYRLEWRDRRYQLFFGWAFVVTVLSQIPGLVSNLPGPWPMTLLLLLASTIVVFIIFIRVMILFPAIAVDAPGATPRHAFADTKGRTWAILFAFIAPFIPSAMIVGLILVAAIPDIPLAGHGLVLGLLGLIKMFWIALAVVIASRLYLELSNRLKRADEEPAEA